jgi:hypothetical protein
MRVLLCAQTLPNCPLYVTLLQKKKESPSFDGSYVLRGWLSAKAR